MLKRPVLVKNISSLSEARYCAGMMVDYISFEFNPSNEYFIEEAIFLEIRNWISGIKILGSGYSGEISAMKVEQYQLNGWIYSQNEAIHNDANFEVFKESSLLGENQKIEDTNYIFIKNSDEPLPQFVKETDFLGYSFDNINIHSNVNCGMAFLASKEEKTGRSSFNKLMEALEMLES
jgi:phosphoribosylanthranilate isomerase